MLGFVTSREKKPAELVHVKFEGTITEVSNPDYESWFQTDQLVKSRLSAIGKPISEPMKIFRLLQGLGREYESLATVVQASMQKPPIPSYNDVVSQLTGFENRIKTYAPVAATPHLAFQVQKSASSGDFSDSH